MTQVKKIGFIGAGNMAAAIIGGIIKKEILSPKSLIVYDIDQKRLDAMENELGVSKSSSLTDVASASDILLICVKPNVMFSVLQDIKDLILQKAVVSIAAGWSAAMIKNIIGHEKKILRLMPNTPLLAGEGMTVFETPSNIDEDDYTLIKSIFGALGQTAEAPEKLMDAVTAISGSGPAYVYMFIDALADGGVLEGMPKELALKLAAQTVFGSAKMVMDTGTHPMVLKDAVCSPGGTTIEAVKVLEDNAFKSTLMQAVRSCSDKSKKLSK
jgi:pyrroline-5-carboxylate reductase